MYYYYTIIIDDVCTIITDYVYLCMYYYYTIDVLLNISICQATGQRTGWQFDSSCRISRTFSSASDSSDPAGMVPWIPCAKSKFEVKLEKHVLLMYIIYLYYRYPRPSKGQVKLGRYTNSRPLPKDHRKPMAFIYINLHNGHVDLGNLGIYVNIYSIRGNPPNPTYTPQPQQQQLRINQFQVYKCQDCLKWPMVPKISMKSPWKDHKIPKQMSKT